MGSWEGLRVPQPSSTLKSQVPYPLPGQSGVDEAKGENATWVLC